MNVVIIKIIDISSGKPLIRWFKIGAIALDEALEYLRKYLGVEPGQIRILDYLTNAYFDPNFDIGKVKELPVEI